MTRWLLVGRLGVALLGLSGLVGLGLWQQGGYGISLDHGFLVVINWHYFGWLN